MALQLYWSKEGGGDAGESSSSSAVREYRQVLPGDRHSFTVSDLDPEATYNFQARTSQPATIRYSSVRSKTLDSSFRELMGFLRNK